MMKKALALITTLVLCLLTLYGCSKPEEKETSDYNPTVTEAPVEDVVAEHPTDPLEMITDGYYVYSFAVEGYGQYDHYFHFYEEAPVVGAVFYAGFVNNQIKFSGTYTVEKKDFSYKVAKDRAEIESGTLNEGTAPYTITFYDFEGNELDSCGFDGDILYQDMTTVVGSGGENVQYLHDIDGEASKYIETYKGEIGVTYLDFVADQDPTSTLTLFHNMTYVDMVGTMIEGSWAMEEKAEGGYTYTLTPLISSDTAALLSVAADKRTSLYTPNGGEEVAMTNTAALAQESGSPEILFSFTGGFTTFDLLTDGTYKFAFDTSVEEYGTWTFDKQTFALTLTQENGNVITPALDDAYNMSFDYKAVVNEQLADTFTSDSKTWGVLTTFEPKTPASAEILFSFTGTYCTFDVLSDNTYKFSYADAGLEEIGSWEFDASTYSLTFMQENENQIIPTLGEDYSFNFEYTAVASDLLKDTFTCDSQTWGAALVTN